MMMENGNGADVAQEAFETAVRSFGQSQEWIKNKASMDEAMSAVNLARQKYLRTSGKEGKAQQCLNEIAARITYYGEVLDVMAQHHPEYVALAWGAFKFVFIGVINHAGLVAELSQALSDIGDRLRLVKHLIILYPNVVQEAVARLYAHILGFFLVAKDWFNKNVIQRAVSSIVNPFELRYKPILTQIHRSFEAIDQIASGANKAETRDLTITVEMVRQELGELRSQLFGMNTRVVEIHDITSRTLKGVDAQGIQLCRMEHAEIVNLMRPYRQPEALLMMCKSIARRRGLWSQPSNDFTAFFQIFNKWVTSTGSSLFTIRAGPKAEMRAKDLAAEVAALLKDSRHPILWYLSERSEPYRQGYLDLTDVLKNLIYQLLRQDTELSRLEPGMLKITQFHSPHSDTEWVDLLLLLLRRVKTCCMVIETEALYDLAGKDQGWSQQLLEIFDRVIESAKGEERTVKVLLVTYGDSTAPQKPSLSSLENNVPIFTIQVLAPRAVPLGRKKRMFSVAATRRNGLARQLGKVKLFNGA